MPSLKAGSDKYSCIHAANLYGRVGLYDYFALISCAKGWAINNEENLFSLQMGSSAK